VLRPFEQPEHDYGAGHRGIDIAAITGVIVTSPAPGIVLFAGRVAGRSILTIDHGGGVVSSYDPALASVSVGDVVAPGQPVAVLEGAAQHCDTGCLHVGVRRQGEYIDPLPFFLPPKRSVLLPLDDDAG
jgi:murein DD-endopeptidase MepM/ murein hydrolase activator NlpD